MEVNLETDETMILVVDGTCKFKVWGERNQEGTMIIESINCGDAIYCKECGKLVDHNDKMLHPEYCSQDCWDKKFLECVEDVE